jgi:hypothetical protein
MAITNNGTQVNIHSSYIPSGYTVPTVTTFTDYEYSKTTVYTVPKSTVQNASKLLTFAALVAAITAAVTADLGDYNATLYNITAYSEITAITDNLGVDEVLYTTGAVNYLVTVITYVKTAII